VKVTHRAAESTSMRAIGLTSATGPASLLREFDCALPTLRPRDILVRVAACATNPVDTKLRSNRGNPGPLDEPTILGFDGAGIVETLGSEATLFQAGQPVFLAGSHIRNGTNADFVAVDERLVGHAPASISLAAAAALPLVGLTAWEGLFECARIPDSLDGSEAPSLKRLLVLPGAGGTGSLIIQLAKLAGLFVVATASRAESAESAKRLGADLVISHREPLLPQLEAAGLGQGTIDVVFNGYDLAANFDEYIAILAPLGTLVDIVPSPAPLPMSKMIPKRLTYSAEFMFTRAAHGVDMEKQGAILTRIAGLVDAGRLQLPPLTTLPWCAESLQMAHEMQEAGRVIGKIVMAREAAFPYLEAEVEEEEEEAAAALAGRAVAAGAAMAEGGSGALAEAA